MRYAKVRYGTVWYAKVRCGAVRYVVSTARLGTVRYGAARLGTVRYGYATRTLFSQYLVNIKSKKMKIRCFFFDFIFDFFKTDFSVTKMN